MINTDKMAANSALFFEYSIPIPLRAIIINSSEHAWALSAHTPRVLTHDLWDIRVFDTERRHIDHKYPYREGNRYAPRTFLYTQNTQVFFPYTVQPRCRKRGRPHNLPLPAQNTDSVYPKINIKPLPPPFSLLLFSFYFFPFHFVQLFSIGLLIVCYQFQNETSIFFSNLIDLILFFQKPYNPFPFPPTI